MNWAIFSLFQNPHYQGSKSRTLSLNTQYFILLKSPRKDQFLYLARQLYPKCGDILMQAYADATSEPYGYLVVSTHLKAKGIPTIQKKAVLGVLTSQQVVCISEIFLNIQHGVVPLNSQQKDKLGQFKKPIRLIAKKGTPKQKKIRYLKAHLGLLIYILKLVSKVLKR